MIRHIPISLDLVTDNGTCHRFPGRIDTGVASPDTQHRMGTICIEKPRFLSDGLLLRVERRD